MRKIVLAVALLIVLALAAGCRSNYPDVPKADVSKDNMREVVIYVPAEDDILETKLAELPKTSNQYRDAIQALLNNDRENEKTFFPKKAKLIDIKVDKQGQTIVNFDQRILELKADSQADEALGIGAIVRTLAEFPEVKKVSLQVEGKTKGRIGDKRIEDWWGFGGIQHQPFSVSGSSDEPSGEESN
jgi:hypothetical protein